LSKQFNSDKDIVQPKKKGIKRVTNQFVLSSYTIADIFFEHLNGYSHALNLKKTVSAFRAKKMWRLFRCGVYYQKLRGVLRCCTTAHVTILPILPPQL
jgi:hypothetical protein